MAPRQPLTNEQRRLLKIIARMPLASAANLAPVLGVDGDRVRRMLATLRSGGWVEYVTRGMTERRQHRWFLTRRAVDELYVTGHHHPSPREEARAAGLAGFHPQSELPAEFTERFALDHDHPAHLEDQDGSPFAAGESPVEDRATATATAAATAAAPATSTRPGPPPPGASRPPCAAWPCWSRSTPWPPACCAAGGSACPPGMPPPPGTPG